MHAAHLVLKSNPFASLISNLSTAFLEVDATCLVRHEYYTLAPKL